MSQAPGSSTCTAATPDVLTSLPVLVIHVNARCNCRCAMCDIWKNTDDRAIDPALIRSVCDSLVPLGVRHVALTGGEPFMNPALRTICESLRARDVSISILSSGLLLARNAEWLDGLVDEVIISIDGPPQTHDKVRGVAGAFRIIAQGVDEACKRSNATAVRARCTVQKLNHNELLATANAVRPTGMRSISYLAADVTSQAFNRELVWPVERQTEISLSPSEVETLVSEIERLLNYEPAGFVLESPEKLRRIVRHFSDLSSGNSVAPICNAPWKSAVVELDGSIRPCFFQPVIGKIDRTTSLEHALNGGDAIAFRSTLDIDSHATCKRCVCSLNYR
jgi:Fe-coproporphyrin III synthase